MKKPVTPPPVPDFDEIPPEKIRLILAHTFSQPDSYEHWDRVRHRSPPKGLSPEEWWYGIKLTRIRSPRYVPLYDARGTRFFYTLPDVVLSHLHWIDSQAHGGVQMDDQVTGEETRDRYIISSIMEEAITSSQLEGASTTRSIAKEMLRTGRRPADRSERMIVNNYNAMQFIRTELRGVSLTPERVVELQRILTYGTLDNPDAVGRLQGPTDDRVAVWDDRDGTLLHIPPPADELPGRLDALCAFANGPIDGDLFIPPIVHAIILHFWLAYDHPFEDGNGRTARALFYWAMLKHGYWLAEYLSISSLLRRAPAKYARAFQYTETDGNDLTYFIIHQLSVLRQSIDELLKWLKRKVGEVRRLERHLRAEIDVNNRQRALLAHALRHPGQRYTVASHSRSHDVTSVTARNDLVRLVKLGFLQEARSFGRARVYAAAHDLEGRLAGGV